MVQNKQKTAKPPKAIKAKVKETTAPKEENWQKVKIKGHVISDDFGGYEGLIGLEVLKDYDATLVKSSQKRVSSRDRAKDVKKKAKKRKPSKGKEDDSSESSSSESEDEEAVTAKSSKKARLAERHAKKMQKVKEKREKRKELRKQKKGEPKDEANDDDDSNDEYAPDRFALLRPPPSDEEGDQNEAVQPEESDDEIVPELISISNGNGVDVSAWNGLGVPAPILRALGEQGFSAPTQIQALTLPAAIHGKKDILGAAETGSGKTLAFGIPMLAGIMELKQRNVKSGIRKAPKTKGEKPAAEPADDEHELTPPPEELDHVSGASDEESDSEEHNQRMQRPLYGLVLTPTRELAVQVKNHLVAAAKYTGIRVAAIFGGLAVAKQERVLRQCPEIVVATPGRLWELYCQGNQHLSKIEDASFLVIDETDRMVEKGHFEELRSLLKVLNSDEQKKQQRQNFVYSATLTLVHDLPEHMQSKLKRLFFTIDPYYFVSF